MTLRALRKLLKSQKHFFAVGTDKWYCTDVDKRFSIEEVVVYSIKKSVIEYSNEKKESYTVKLAKREGMIEYEITDMESLWKAPVLVYNLSQAHIALLDLKSQYMADEFKRTAESRKRWEDRAYYSTLQLNK